MDTQPETTADPHDTTPAAPSPAKQRLLSPLRIFLILVLGVMVVAWLVDRRARWNAQSAFDALQTALGNEKSLQTVTPEDVQRLADRAPDEDADPNDAYEQYSWQGVPYKHTVYVVYWRSDETRLKDVSLNQPPR